MRERERELIEVWVVVSLLLVGASQIMSSAMKILCKEMSSAISPLRVRTTSYGSDATR